MSAPRRSWARTVGYSVVLVGAVTFVAANRSEVPTALRALRHSRPEFVIAGIVLVFVALANQTGFHEAAQRAAGLEVGVGELARPVAAGAFLNLVVKSGAMAGIVPLVAAAKRKGRPRGATIAGYLLVNVLGHLAFACALLASLATLIVDGRFTRVDALATAVFTVTTGMQLILVGLALKSREKLQWLYGAPRRMADTLRGKHRRVDQAPLRSRSDAADELYDAVRLFARKPWATAPAAAHAIAVEAIGMAQLWCVLRALDSHAHISVAIVAYSVSVLFTIVGFLPGGIGFAEAGLGGVLVSSGLDGPTAAAAVVMYRVLELWFPMAIGAVAAHSIGRTRPS